MNRIGTLLSLIAVCTPLIKGGTDPLYYGETSENFVIRWAFQDFCDHVFDPRTGQWEWPTKSKGGVTFDPNQVKAGDCIFIRDAELFFKKMHPLIKQPYIIVTHGEHLDAMNYKHLRLLEEDKVIAWFGIHPSKKVQHPKYFPIPIGVVQEPEHYKKRAALHQMFKRLRQNSEQTHLLYMNFAAQDTKPERQKVREVFGEQSYCKRGRRQSFHSYLHEMAQCKFTLSPKGLGPDCYRTWESLLVGSIPIVRRSQLDPLFEGLPVLIIDDWDDVDEEFLLKKYKEIRSKKYDLRRLYMEYWISKIKAVRDCFLTQNG